MSVVEHVAPTQAIGPQLAEGASTHRPWPSQVSA
jgi:hypothetical protein